MGRGDKRTAKGKRTKGSFGNSRRHKIRKGAASVAAKPVEKTAPEAPVKKTRKKKAE